MKKFSLTNVSAICLSTVLLTSGLLGSKVEAAENDFKDVPNTYGFYEEIDYLADEAIVEGTKDGYYLPEKTVTRAEAAVMIGRALDFENTTPQSTKFKDVNPESFASGYIARAVEAGIIKGYTDGTYRPSEMVNRGEMAIFLARTFDLTEKSETILLDMYPTITSHESVRLVYEAGIASGYTDFEYKPHLDVNRAQFAAFLARGLNESFAVENKEYAPYVVTYRVDDQGKYQFDKPTGSKIVVHPLQPVSLQPEVESERIGFSGMKEYESERYGKLFYPDHIGGDIITNGDRTTNGYYSLSVISLENSNEKELNKAFGKYAKELAEAGQIGGSPMGIKKVRLSNVIDKFGYPKSTVIGTGEYGLYFGRVYGDTTYYVHSEDDGRSVYLSGIEREIPKSEQVLVSQLPKQFKYDYPSIDEAGYVDGKVYTLEIGPHPYSRMYLSLTFPYDKNSNLLPASSVSVWYQ